MLKRRPQPVFLAASRRGDTLVLLLHGCTWTTWGRKTQLRQVVDAVQESLPSADVLMPILPIEFWSLQNPDGIVAHVLEDVETS
jgi:hypothetical protein